MQMKYTGRGRLLEDGHYHYPGDLFEVDNQQRAEQLLADPHVSVEIAESDYAHFSRAELNQLATEAGVSDPESLPNKQAVIDALINPEAEAASGEGHPTPSPEED